MITFVAGNVLMGRRAWYVGNALILLTNVHAFNHLAKYGVTPTLNGRRAGVEEVVVGHVIKNCALSGVGSMVRAMATVPIRVATHCWLRLDWRRGLFLLSCPAQNHRPEPLKLE